MDTLSVYHQEIITQSIREADASLGRPFDEITREIKENMDLMVNAIVLIPTAIAQYNSVIECLMNEWKRFNMFDILK